MKFKKIMKLLNDKKHMMVGFVLGWLIASNTKVIPIFVLIIYIFVHLYSIWKL